MSVPHTRRSFLKAATVAAGAALAQSRIAAASTERPNILLILADDLGKEWISCYGAEDIKTPNIDTLAAGGMTFGNAYSMPQCTPSRATLLTGQYPWRNGWVNHWDVPRWGVGYFDWKQRRNTTFARLLQDQGYATCAAGKWQINDFRLEPRAMEQHGFEDSCMWTGYESGNEASAERYFDPYINTPAGSRTCDGKFGPDVFTDYLIEFMRKHADRPLCLYYPMVLTHSPLTTTPDEPEAKTDLEKHKAMVRYMDKLVGRLVDALDDLELRRNTIVIFTTDNGSGGLTGTMNGRKVPGGKGTESEAGVCAPFIVNCPGRVPAGVMTDALTDFTDLLPTFVALGGGTVPADLSVDGVSIAPLLLGQAQDSPREWIMAMGHGPARVDAQGVRGQDDFTSRVMRDKRYKVWVNNQRQIDRLHDLQQDLWEENNLIGSSPPEHVHALAKFEAILSTMPPHDARPLYEPRKPNPWDRKPGAQE
ncbi:MAG: sulfatase-like hydrolase/transferase [Candidatus Hydrogenedentes bacterium]|nr:sulfatase-like hydrolase/transferase [Candidatus Hydrogenedentota bacterium]